MFERITFRQQNTKDPGRPIDIGLLLEALIFYQKTFIIADTTILRQLIKAFGFHHLNELLDRGILDIIFTETHTAIHTTSQPNGHECHSPIIFSSPQHTFQIEIRKICIEQVGKEGKGRRNARRIEQKLKIVRHDLSLTKSAEATLLDHDFLRISVPKILDNYVTGVGDCGDIVFKTEKTENGIIVLTNLDFNKLNTFYHKIIPPSHSSLSSALILSHLYNIETDLYFASRQLSEIATTPLSTKLISVRLCHLAHRCNRSNSEKDTFQELIFKENKSLREAFNNGQIDIESVMKVILEAGKFKAWLNKQDVDSNLIREYYKEVTRNSLIDRLPGKSLRWSIFTGLGIACDMLNAGGIGTVAGVSLSILDEFLLEKIIKGWKPNQFVEEILEQLITNP